LDNNKSDDNDDDNNYKSCGWSKNRRQMYSVMPLLLIRIAENAPRSVSLYEFSGT